MAAPGFADWLAIADLKARYCRLLDSKDWDGFAALFTAANTLKLSSENYEYYCYQRYGLQSMTELTDGQIAEQIKLLDSLQRPERLAAFRDILGAIENERLAAQAAQHAAAARQIPTEIAHTVQ